MCLGKSSNFDITISAPSRLGEMAVEPKSTIIIEIFAFFSVVTSTLLSPTIMVFFGIARVFFVTANKCLGSGFRTVKVSPPKIASPNNGELRIFLIAVL